MELPEMIFSKKTKRYYAGDVVAMEYIGEGKPCNKAIAILLTPFTIKDGHTVAEFGSMYTLDTDTETFLPAGPIGNGKVQCNITKVTGKLKAWYFEKVLEYVTR